MPRHLIPLASALVVTGCVAEINGDAYTSDLTVDVYFDGASCSSAGVDSIVVELEGLDTGLFRSRDVSCRQSAGRVFFGPLPWDDYDVHGQGYGDGYLFYDGLFTTFLPANASKTITLDLPATRGDLVLYWEFLGDATCLDVSDVRVILYDPFGDLYDDDIYPCDQEGVAYDDVVTGVWAVTFDGLDARGRVLYTREDRSVRVDAYEESSFVVDLDVF